MDRRFQQLFPGGVGGAYRRYPGGRRNNNSTIIHIAIILAQQIAAMPNKPPFTLAITALLALLHFAPLMDLPIHIPASSSACLNPGKILFTKQWTRLLWSPLLHGDELHLFYNVSSFLWKGAQLEPSLGLVGFSTLIAELALTSQVIYCGLAYLNYTHNGGLLGFLPSINSCAIGFSAVLFGLKVILTHGAAGWSTIFGIQLPTKYTAWAELVVAQFLSGPRVVSFWGHVSGILAGLLHVYVVKPIIMPLIFRRRAVVGQRNAAFNRRERPRTWG